MRDDAGNYFLLGRSDDTIKVAGKRADGSCGCSAASTESSNVCDHEGKSGRVVLNSIGNGGENFHFRHIGASAGNAALMAFTLAFGGRGFDDRIRVVGVNPGPVAADRIVKIMRPAQSNDARYTELLAAYLARARGNCARSGRPVYFPGFSSTAVSRPAAGAKGLRPVGKGENK